jgi:hypothetical protein
MAAPFFERLRRYYRDVGKVLRDEADAASIFPNTTDIGVSRERVYAEFLRQHLPSSCSVMLGGFLFDRQGRESKQVDIIVVDDLAPQFNFHNRDGHGKAFACIDGCVGVASIKSTLNSAELRDTLENFASLPDKTPAEGRQNPLARINGYDNWPFKIVYAKSGVSLETMLETLNDFYRDNPSVPHNRRPDLIHVGASSCIAKVGPEGGSTRDGTMVSPGSFHPMSMPGNADAYALPTVVAELQTTAAAARYLITDYKFLVENIRW